MQNLVSPDELAEALNVSPEILERRTRDEDWIRREYPVAQWAVWTSSDDLEGYDVPPVVSRKLGLNERENDRRARWWHLFS